MGTTGSDGDQEASDAESDEDESLPISYYFHWGLATYAYAKENCQLRGGKIVSIHSQEENNEVKTLITRPSWIGFTDEA